MNNSPAKKNSLGGILMLTACAFIWGTAFIAQSLGSNYAEPLTFNCARSVLATIFLLGCCFVIDKISGRPFTISGTTDPLRRERLLKGGVLCGIALSLASFMQQLGIMYTTVGKSGFITALYIVLVPLLSFLVLRRSVSLLQWAGVAVAAVGMYFICINEGFSINKGDFYTLICAFCFAGQIICVDKIITDLDGVRLSLVQFATCTVLNGVLMLIFENPSWSSVLQGWAPIAYAGIMSSGVAYTLQITGQKHCSPVLACMLMSLESAFALLSGWLFLGQAMSAREIFGCALVFAAIMLAQIPESMLPWSKNRT
ncbi:MAG: DMT family transporter [Phascolarctobacterium sp.]|uniref:DMT family transporter n=1 Tax=Phascolarctobacterium sp. TaxID=2049039 RepID=UPI0026DD969D|nr:DMT family transporter [Phascolarctobacterium sp.]MDO4922263.1 DMT family transporter [Phascolarctobacterium sp.]